MNKDEAEVVIKDTIDYANNEIKRTKKKFRRILLIILLVLASFVLYFALKPVSYKYAESDLFSEDDIRSAMDCVKTDFKSLHGCKLFSLSYYGDAKTYQEIDRRERQGPQYDEYIVISSVFLSPLTGISSWNNGEIYTWDWILGRNANGEWVVIDKGYC